MFRLVQRLLLLLFLPLVLVRVTETLKSSPDYELQLQNDLLNLVNGNGKLSDSNLKILEHEYPEIENKVELHKHKEIFQVYGHEPAHSFLNELQSSRNKRQNGSVPTIWSMTPRSSLSGDETSNFSHKRIKTKDPFQSHYYLPLQQDHDDIRIPIGINGLISSNSPHASSLSSSSSYSSSSQIQCLCDTYECLSNGQKKCWTSGKCYTQYLELSDGSPPLTKGCILGETPLLCENRRPNRPGPYPRLACCSTNLCNSNYTLASFSSKEVSGLKPGATLTGFSSSISTSRPESSKEGLGRDYYYSEEENEEDNSGSAGTIFEDTEPAGGLHDLSNFDLNDNVTEKSDGVYGHKIHGIKGNNHGIQNSLAFITRKQTDTYNPMSQDGYTQTENFNITRNSQNVDNNHAYYNGIKISPVATGFLISGCIFVVLISIIGYLVLRWEQRNHEMDESNGKTYTSTRSDSNGYDAEAEKFAAFNRTSIDVELESKTPLSKSTSISIESLSASPRTPLRRKPFVDFPDVETQLGSCIAYFEEESVESIC